MFSPKRHLILEWENVEQTLRETLRYRYNKNVTVDFYEECTLRLDYIRHLIDSVQGDDEPGLNDLMGKLNALSVLVTNIERSHLEEFAWPFAEALKRIYRDAFGKDVLFMFRAEGDLCSYAVRPESIRTGIFKRRINSVVFPRALKDSVLLHVIIGHEFGHAALVSDPTLNGIIRGLIAESVVAEPQKLFQWCADNIGVINRIDDGYLREKAYRWAVELFCDLFALVTMGPSFLPAFQSLLEILSFRPSQPYVGTHPPFASRAVMLLHAARSLELLYSERSSPNDLMQLSAPLDKGFVDLATKWAAGPFSILDPARVAQATIELSQFAQNRPLLAFPAPDAQLISQLMRSIGDKVPPAGMYPATITASPDGAPLLAEPRIVDFRLILFAGWLTSSVEPVDKNEAHFRQVNRMCSHAIMQQEGIVHWLESEARLSAQGAT